MSRNSEEGERCEDLASEHLIRQGYAIRERRWRVSNSIEIDIIAQKGATIAFVEVKGRERGAGDPVEAVDNRKRTRMVRGADIYLSSLDHPYDYRFDICAVSFDKGFDNVEVEYIEDAFMPEANNGF